MAVTVRDILTLKCTNKFILVAGRSGLSKRVEMIDMLDFGWEHNQDYTLNLFNRNSIVISSLMLAKGDSNKLFKIIRRLIECGVVGLAYKPIFYKDMPIEICRFADENDFPIFRIDDTITYREIICEVTDVIQFNKNIFEKEKYLLEMMFKDLSEEYVSDIVKRISPYFLKNAKVIMILGLADKSCFSLDYVIRHFKKYEQFKDKVALFKFGSGLALIVTMNNVQIQKFDVITNNVFSVCGINQSSVWLGHSKIHHTYTALDRCIKEAFYALVAGQVLDKQDIQYCNIGTLSFLIPMVNNFYIQANMQDYLSPIVRDENYMRTAIEFIRAEGDFEVVAKKLNYHKNTIRYRIDRIKSKLSPELSYEAFYERLSIAIKAYLIKRYNTLYPQCPISFGE
jgi:hypothetical protein